MVVGREKNRNLGDEERRYEGVRLGVSPLDKRRKSQGPRYNQTRRARRSKTASSKMSLMTRPDEARAPEDDGDSAETPTQRTQEVRD